MASSWFLFFSYHNDARSNKHQISSSCCTSFGKSEKTSEGCLWDSLQEGDAFNPMCSTAELLNLFFFLWRCGPTRAMASSFLTFLDHTQRSTTVGRTPLDEWWARRRDLYLTTHNTYNRQTSMQPVGFEPTISAGERPQTLRLRPRGHWDRPI